MIETGFNSDKLLQMLEECFIQESNILRPFMNTSEFSVAESEAQTIFNENIDQSIVMLVNHCHAQAKDRRVYISIMHDYMEDNLSISYKEFTEFLNTLVIQNVITNNDILEIFAPYDSLRDVYEKFVKSYIGADNVGVAYVMNVIDKLHETDEIKAREFMIDKLSEDMPTRTLLKEFENNIRADFEVAGIREV